MKILGAIPIFTLPPEEIKQLRNTNNTTIKSGEEEIQYPHASLISNTFVWKIIKDPQTGIYSTHLCRE
jgi:hypothetical protein